MGFDLKLCEKQEVRADTLVPARLSRGGVPGLS